MPLKKRATCKKCAAEFFLDPTVVTEVPDLANEMIRSAEAKATIQLEEKPASEPVAEVAPARKGILQTKILWGAIATVSGILMLSILAMFFLKSSDQPANQSSIAVQQNPDQNQGQVPVASTVQETKETKKQGLGTGDSFILKLFKFNNLELELFRIDEASRTYKTASKVYLTCDGNAEDISMLSLQVDIEDMLHLMKDENGKDRAPVAEDFENAIRLCMLSVRPSLTEQVKGSYASNFTKTMLERSRHFIEKSGLKIVFGFPPNDTNQNYCFVIVPSN